MTDTSMFGGQGTDLGSFGTGLAFNGGAPAPEAAAPDPTPAPSAPPAAPTFGSGFSLGPNYRAPDPAASALDQTADTLQQRIERANKVATNPILQFFNPEGAQKARDFVPAATEQLQKIRQQKADMQANATQAQTLGLSPGEVPDEASQADRVAVAQSKALKGDLKVFKGLQAVDPKAAEAIQDQVHEAVGAHLTKAQFAFDSLSAMQNQGQYQAKVDALRKDGTLAELETLGLKVPSNYDTFNASKGREGQALREARIGVDTIRQKLEDRNTYQPMEEKEAKTYNGRMTTALGDQITNGTWGRNGASGNRGLIVNGAADPRDLGKTFTLGTDEQRKALRDESGLQVTKAEIDKNRAFSRTYQLATTDSKGNPIPADAKNPLNTNPNVQQGIAEGLASMLRGGGGGATAGLLKIESSKRSYTQSLLDMIAANYAGGINALSGGADPEKVKPYLTQLTQNQQRQVLDTLKAYNDQAVGSRVGRTAERAGALGFDSSVFGYGKGENGEIDDAIERGRQAQVARMLPYHQAIGGGDGVFQLGAQRPGAGATTTPPGTATTTQLPGAAPLQTPVQQANGPAGTAPSSPTGGPNPGQSPTTSPAPAGGPGGGPTTVAGQQVSFTPPPGVSPSYLPATQRIESGNSKRDPWTATTPGSSASGAYQMIDSTWAANKPPGAPARAKDATPAQQTQAMETFSAKNAAALQKSGLPVNDVNMYVAHNLGESGGPKLLHADPDADARSIVGETAAKNNPTFFKGRPTVAMVLQRYQDAMHPADNGGTAAPAAQPPTFMQRLMTGDIPGGRATTERARETGIENAPAIGSTLGAAAGSALGPLGTIGGGAAGGGAGQSFKDYMQGRTQSPAEIAKQTALGGVLGVAPAGRPLLGAAARVGGSAAVEGGAAAAEGGDAGDIAAAGVKGGGLALGGEAIGRFISSLGPAAHKLFSKFTPDAQAELSAQAGKLVEARKVLETEQPTSPGVGGAAGVANPKFEAAKKAEEDASQFIKDHGQKPDDMAYAYEQTKAGTSAGEAAVMRKANAEKGTVSEGYDTLRKDMRETGVGAVKPNQPMPDGPVAQIRTTENPTGKVPEAFRADAEHAEMLAKAPAPNGWGEKWQQLQDAGSELIKKRMDFLAAGDKTSAAAMNGLFEGVRNQQKAAAEYVFGKDQGAKVISHLEDLDKRYAKVMNATKGMNYEKMRTTIQAGNTAERRDLEANFKEFAKDDPSAIRAFNAMKAGAQGRMGEEAKLMIPVIAGEFAANMSGVPTVGVISAAVGGHRLVSLMKDYMNAKILGRPVTFKDFAVDAMKAYAASHGPLNAAGSAVQRGMVMQ